MKLSLFSILILMDIMVIMLLKEVMERYCLTINK